MIQKYGKSRGSILVFTLLVLAILLSATLTSAGVVISGKNSSRATEKSALAFQIADGAAENVLKRIYKNEDATLSELARNLYTSSSGEQSAPICQTGGVITGTLPNASGTYSVSFFNSADEPIGCTGEDYDTYDEWRGRLARIVVSGSYAGATRAIDVSVKPEVCIQATVDDADGNTYDTLAIGNQCWLARNIRFETRRNSSTPQTNNSITEYYCYDDSNSNCTTNHSRRPDGGLYTWNEAMQYDTSDPQGICPDGFHIPTNDEWYELERYLDPTVVLNAAEGVWNGTNAGTVMKPDGTSGFEANLAGRWRTTFGFSNRNTVGYFWTSDESGSGAWNHQVRSSDGMVNRSLESKTRALSVRCVQD